ncbi:MAG TPA: type II toxin-antitoxin system RelE/ParE family toxin [Puia sp.]|nr:type II toxin-antitoxin system RelE/ParE family toxin [Puia sp.]
MYQVVIEKQAQKQLVKISPPDYTKVVAALKELASNPRPHGYKKLKGRPGYRVRIGDYRIIYSIQDDILTVFILTIGHRREVYD